MQYPEVLTAKQVSDYFENECAFRDYEIVNMHQWMHPDYSAPRSINIIPTSIDDLNDALNTFVKDGYGTIVVYVNSLD